MAEELRPVVSADPSDARDLRAALAFMLRQHELRSNQLLPAEVISFDRAKNVATVRPLIMWVDVKDNLIKRNSIANVPVLSLGGGGFHISFPLAPGDLGWIYAADRDLSLFKEQLKESAPNTGRTHRFEDSMFVPDVFRKYTISGEDSSAMVLQSTNSATRISIRQDNVKITAPSQVEIDTPTTVITGDVQIQKSLTVTEATTANGGFTAASGKPCTLPDTTTVNGKTVNGHQHSGVQTGSSSTNPF